MTEHEQRRLANHRLAVLQHAEEVTGNVARTCRYYYGISRQTLYKWLRRYEKQGLEGLREGSLRKTGCESNAKAAHGKTKAARRILTLPD